MKCSSASWMKPRRPTMPGACARAREPGGLPCAYFPGAWSKSSYRGERGRAWSNSSCPGTGAGSSVPSTCTGPPGSQRRTCCQSRSVFLRSDASYPVRYIENQGPPRIRSDGGTIRLAGAARPTGAPPPCAAALHHEGSPRDAWAVAFAAFGSDGLALRENPGPATAHALGQLFTERHDQPERLPPVSADIGSALPPDSRTRAHQAHESFKAILAPRRTA